MRFGFIADSKKSLKFVCRNSNLSVFSLCFFLVHPHGMQRTASPIVLPQNIQKTSCVGLILNNNFTYNVEKLIELGKMDASVDA